MKIKFYCRSFNKELYLLSRRLYEDAGYPCVRLTDQTADGYFLTMMRDTDCDIAINVDEDCFLTDLDAVLALARRVEEEGLVNAGCSDAALGCPRGGNAMVTNPFFNVFNLRLLREKWSLEAYRRFDYASVRPQLEQDFREHGPALETIRTDLKFEAKDVEPYYNFFFWMLQSFPGLTLYLDSKRNEDKVTTQLFSEGRQICSHTWFARQYHPSFMTRLFEGNDKKGMNHSERIDHIIDEAYAVRQLQRPQFSGSDRMDFRRDAIVRWSIKVPQRVANWPNKLRKKLGR